MSEKNDPIAATTGVDSLIRQKRRKAQRWRATPSAELSDRLLDYLGLPKEGANVTVDVPTGQLTLETFAPTIRVTTADGEELPEDRVNKALEEIKEGQGDLTIKIEAVRKWQVRHTIISIIVFIFGVIVGELDLLAMLTH